jgi:CDP-diacylglycerol--glycerol-3-phosphate 3-phosphatidyltransferase
MILNLPTLLTLLRIALIPILIALSFSYLPDKNLLLCIVFIIAAVSDWLDGYLARNLGQVTRFGSFLDPVADKILVSISLILLLIGDQNRLFAIAVIVIIAREIIISGLREWMSTIGESHKVAVNSLGKLKTGLQMTGISLMFYKHPIVGIDVYSVGMILIVTAMAITIWSMVIYFMCSWAALRKN